MEYNLKGRKFSRLKVLKKTGEKSHGCNVWECKCKCGKIIHVRTSNLISGETKSCGCLHTETALERSKTVRDNNLKDGTNIGNIRKNKAPSHNTSGCRGVSWHKGVGMWSARIQFQGVMHQLGYRSDINDAINLRKEAEIKYFGEYLKNRKE